MTNDGKLFSDKITNWLIYEAVFNKYKLQISVYYKYAPDGSKLVVSYYVDDCVYWYKSEELVNWFVVTLGKILHVNFLGYAHWFISIRISQHEDFSILVDLSRYATSVVAKYLDTITINENQIFHKTNITHDMIFTKEDDSTSEQQVEVLFREYKIHYRSCVG